MKIRVKLTNKTDNSVDICDVKTDSLNEIEYIDNYGCKCKICVFDDGIELFRQAEDHDLKLSLRENSQYCQFISTEGTINLDAKVVDFSKNNGILVMRYIIENDERSLEIYEGDLL